MVNIIFMIDIERMSVNSTFSHKSDLKLRTITKLNVFLWSISCDNDTNTKVNST